ncbi:MAG: ABC transporter ATP-binding protein [Propionibacteriaceae bacterium]|jgi:ABC-type dipeptide/oligopeptide/nickel transport system ATPase component|nr:ABC transporter ATP-binding protein [Propionibacteriaceae bacterium]
MNTVQSPGAELGDTARPDNILELAGLSVDIVPRRGPGTSILRNVDVVVPRGQTLGVVGESGSGKTMTLRAILSLLPHSAQRVWERCVIDGVPYSLGVKWPVAMVFQDPMTALDPLRKIGFHLTEVIGRFQPDTKHRAKSAIAALEEVGIDDPERRFRQYPHELSGGMRQRVMIAMALLARPKLLVADEPTTALDVTVQAQILDLVRHVKNTEGLSVILVTHDLGVVAEMCDQVVVMCAGRVVEAGTVDEVFYDARHPYTVGLLDAIPGRSDGVAFGSVSERVGAEWLSDDAVYSQVSETHRYLVPSEQVGS